MGIDYVTVGTYLVVYFCVMILVFLIIRQLVLWYLRINTAVNHLAAIEKRLASIDMALHSQQQPQEDL